MITVKFSCEKCGLKDHVVQVPARERIEDDVVHYVQEVVGNAVRVEHKKVSPNCDATTITNLMIPMENAEFIGQQIE